MAIRIVDAISFSEPLLVMTSGAEFETNFALWKSIHGHAVYTSPYEIPYAASYYGWLFYAVYGEIIGTVMRVLSLSDEWLQTLGRLVSLSVTAAGTWLCWRILVLAARGQPLLTRLAAPLALTIFFGPLIGYWAISLNCEIGATTLTLAGAYVVLRRYERDRLGTVAIASLLSLAAWSFKQSYVYPAVTLGLFLLLRRDLASLLVMVAIHALGVSLVIWAGSPAFLGLFFLFDQTMSFAFWQLARNLINLAVKTTPHLALLVPLAALAMLIPSRWRTLADDTLLAFGVCGLAATSVMTIAASAKIGAAENYYFPMVPFLAYAGVAAASWLAEHEVLPRLHSPALTAGFALHAAACLAVILGFTGVTKVEDYHKRYVEHRECLKGRLSPIITSDVMSNLPWISGSEGPHFVLANIYYEDRALGRTFERGGVSGLIKEGYFGTIALWKNSPQELDGTNVTLHYEVEVDDCAGLTIYRRRQDAAR